MLIITPRDPVFASIMPDAFAETPLTPDERNWLQAAIPEARKAMCLRRSATSAYFRVETTDRMLFAKSVTQAHADRIRAGELLSCGLPRALTADMDIWWGNPAQPVLFVYPYLPARHPNFSDAPAIARAITSFHQAGKKAGIDTRDATHARLARLFAQPTSRDILIAYPIDEVPLFDGAVACHGDTVAGNIMIQGGQALLIDFEEYPHSAFNPLWDLARIGERLTLSSGRSVFPDLLSAYESPLDPAALKPVGIAMNIINLCLVALQPDTEAKRKEAKKFRQIMKFYEENFRDAGI